MSGNPKIIAITGATGFVGLHLVPHLLAQGYHVRALVRSPRKIPEDWKNNKLFQMVKGDLSSDLTQLIQDADAVIHMAGLIKARTRAEFMSVNAAGCENIAQTAQACGVAKCVYLSSMTAREPQLSDYAASKRAGEQAFANHYTCETVIIRAPAVFGPKDEATKPIFDLMPTPPRVATEGIQRGSDGEAI